MKSMTGYARRQNVVDGKKITIEIKTLNSKQLDLNTKIPAYYRGKELDIRVLLNRLERGKVDFFLIEEGLAAGDAQLNYELVKARFDSMNVASSELKVDMESAKILECVFRQSDVWATADEQELSDEGWTILRQTIEETIDDVEQFRLHEGEILKEDFNKHVDDIERNLQAIPQYESERLETAKERIRKYFADLALKELDENRFEQEMIYYLEKLDITEEKVRLQKHIDYFRETMAEPVCGKKLGFVAQEMGREINTTGSKANHVEIQKLVVRMKDELEKIKEQLGNIL